MKWFKILIVVFIFSLSGCDWSSLNESRYKIQGDEIYYWEIQPSFKLEADKESFTILSDNYAKDKDHVFYGSKLIIGADPQTFQVMNWYYAKDKNNIYQYDKIVEGADINTFTLIKVNPSLEAYFGKDNDQVFCYEKNIPKIQPANFKMYNVRYIGDENNIFYYDCYHEPEKLQGVDINTFSVIDRYRAKDKNQVYYLGKILVGADPDTFEGLDGYFDKDAESVWHYGELVEGADATTFEVINEYEGRDENQNYYFD